GRQHARPMSRLVLGLFSGLVMATGSLSAGAASQASQKVASAAPSEVVSQAAETDQVIPPKARQAVVDAREAMQKKQWKKLASKVEPAAADPVLGMYAQYWHLRQQLHDASHPN